MLCLRATALNCVSQMMDVADSTRLWEQIDYTTQSVLSQRILLHKLTQKVLIFCWPCISLQFFANDQLDTLFRTFVYYTSVHVSSIKCTSSGDRIVLIHHLVWLVCVSDCLVCWSGGTGIPSSHSHRLIIPDDVLIQFDLLMMSSVMLETCTEV